MRDPLVSFEFTPELLPRMDHLPNSQRQGWNRERATLQFHDHVHFHYIPVLKFVVILTRMDESAVTVADIGSNDFDISEVTNVEQTFVTISRVGHVENGPGSGT